jgi:hypothetical protein
MGERFRNATPTELRWYSGGFVFLPIWLASVVRLGHSYLHHASAIGIFAYMMASILGGVIWLAIWAKFIPSDVSWWVGGVVWVIALWLAFTNKLI